MTAKIYLTKEAQLQEQIKLLNEALEWHRFELKYHEQFQIDGDGHRCMMCERVRYIDDCFRSEDGQYCCSLKCKYDWEREYRIAQETEAEDAERERKWSNGGNR